MSIPTQSSTSSFPATDLSNLTNYAAVLPAEASPFVIQPTPLLYPGPYEILIRTRAVAINPVDTAIATLTKDKLPFPVKYPTRLGFDVSGEVVEVYVPLSLPSFSIKPA